MSTLHLTVACLDSDRVMPLITKSVEPIGIDLNILPYSPDRSVWAMVQHQEFDVSEMTLAIYARLCAKGQTPYIAIPVFLARTFPHGGIFVNKKSEIIRPKDLEGRKVACGQFQMTMAVWARGVLHQEYGVDPKTIDWQTREPEVEFDPPKEFKIGVLPPGKSLPDRLADGDVDALILPRVAPQFRWNHPQVKRLFPDYKAVELDYFSRTKIFPILHTLVIHEKIYHQHPWAASSLYRAFVEAKETCYRNLSETMEGGRYMLPWLESCIEETWKIMGEDFWPYGLEANRHALETYIRYLHEQHLIERPMAVEELFAPNTID